MIENGATIRHPYIYGEILSRSLSQSPLSELPGFGRCLSQGIVVGAFVSFLCPVIGMLLDRENGYNFLFIYCLPVILAIGMWFGLLEGVALWACSYISSRRLNVLARAIAGTLVLGLLIVILDYFYSARQFNNTSLRDWLPFLAFYCGVGAVFGLVSGSKFNPISELLRGTAPPRWVVLNGITGFFLRVLVIFATMESTLTLIWMTQAERHEHDFIFAAIALSHCIAATVIVFTRMPFWVLLLLAVLINFPVVVLITDVLTNEILRGLVIAYLTLWAAFLLCRVSVPPAVLSFLKEEIRYYLID